MFNELYRVGIDTGMVSLSGSKVYTGDKVEIDGECGFVVWNPVLGDFSLSHGGSIRNIIYYNKYSINPFDTISIIESYCG